MSEKETVQKCTVSFDLCYIVTKINLKIKENRDDGYHDIALLVFACKRA